MPGRSDIPTIAWDVDDVLNELTRAWFDRWLSEGRTGPEAGYEGLTRNPPDALLGIGRSEYLESLDDFRASVEGEDLPPRPEAVAWFEANGDRFRHVAVTATPLANAPASAAWVMRHFGRWIRTYHVVPSPRGDEPLQRLDVSKAHFFEWLGNVDLVVDDSPEVVDAARELGVATVLFPQPWNGATGGAIETFDSVVPTIHGRVSGEVGAR